MRSRSIILVFIIYLVVLEHVHSFVTSSSTFFKAMSTYNKPQYEKKQDIDIGNKKVSTLLNQKKKISKGSATEQKELIADMIQQLLKDLDLGDDDESSEEDHNQEEILSGVVRIYCTHSQPNFGMPWQRKKQESSTSSGFMIDNKYILTNAHAVEYGSLIQVKKRQSESKYLASVVAVGHECDLAILTIEDSGFWEGTKPLQFGELPDLLEDVSVIGYPIGGDSVSITSGVVSRIEMQEYAQASAELLAIQIDAAINPGNSGGPVVDSENKVIGVAFQSLSSEDTENIGYVVPVNVIEHFLDDVRRHGTYSGVCGIGVRLQSMENEKLRTHFRMSESHTGVRVLGVAPLAPAAAILQTGDVILSVDGIRVANDGSIPFREGSFKERVQLGYYLSMKFPGDVISIDILRAGQVMTVSVPMWVPQKLVPRTLLQKNVVDASHNRGTGSKGSIVGGNPSYLLVGGLVLVALSREYLESEFNPEHMHEFEYWADEFRILALADASQTATGEETVLLSQVIANDCNVGYENLENLILRSFNGQKVHNLRQVKQLLDTAMLDSEEGSGALVFEFSTGVMLVLDKQRAKEAQDQICKEHFIPSICSPDLLER